MSLIESVWVCVCDRACVCVSCVCDEREGVCVCVSDSESVLGTANQCLCSVCIAAQCAVRELTDSILLLVWDRHECGSGEMLYNT